MDDTVRFEPEIEPENEEKAGVAGIVTPFTISALAESPTAIPG
jgi:hypothetical protein